MSEDNEQIGICKTSVPKSLTDQALRLLNISMLNSKFLLLIYVKMPTVVGILTLVSGINSILGYSEPEKRLICFTFILMSI